MLLNLWGPQSAADGFSVKPAPLYPTPDPVIVRLMEEALGHEKNEIQKVCVEVDPETIEAAIAIPVDGQTEVWAAGDFNGWKPGIHRLVPGIRGGLALTLELPAGRYAYKLVVSGKWLPNPSNSRTIPDGFGGMNSFVVAGPDEVRPRLYPVPCDPGGSSEGFAGNSRVNAAEFLVFVFGSTFPVFGASAALDGRLLENSMVRVMSGGRRIKVFLPLGTAPGGRFTLSARTALGTLALPLEAWVGNLLPPRGREKKETLENTGRIGPTGIIYFAFTDRFRNGCLENDDPVAFEGLDPRADFKGGDFAGLEMSAREGYFKSLCCDYLWISPVNDNARGAWEDSLPPNRLFSAYHGYWPTQLFTTQPRFGTVADLRRLSKSLRERGEGLMLDVVLNHLHEDSPYLRTGSLTTTPEFLPDGRRNLRLFDSHPVTTWFDSFVPSLDYGPETGTADIMSRNARWWAGVTMASGLRLDAVKHLPVELFRTLREKIPEETSVFMVGETIDSRETISRYIGPGLMNAQFDFPLYFAIRDTLARQACGLDQLEVELTLSEEAFGSLAGVSTLLGNHDFARFCAYADGDVNPGTDEKEPGWSERVSVDGPKAYERLAVAFAFLLTNRGYPLIYYGDEIGMTGAGDPDNRRPFEGPGGVGFTGLLSAPGAALLEKVRALAGYRARHRHMVHGTRIPLAATADGIAYLRVWTDGATLVALGRPGREVTLDFILPGGLPWAVPGTGTIDSDPEHSAGRIDLIEDSPTGEKRLKLTVGCQGYSLFSLVTKGDVHESGKW